MPALPLQQRRRNKAQLRTRRREKPATIVAVPPEVSDALELAGFGTFAAVGSSDTINTVTVTMNQFQSNTLMTGPRVELWDFSGSGVIIGTLTGAATTTVGNVDSLIFSGITYGQLATLRVRVYGNQGKAPPGSIQYLNWTSLTVNYTPASGNTNVLGRVATGAGVAASPVAQGISDPGKTPRFHGPAIAARTPAQPATFI